MMLASCNKKADGNLALPGSLANIHCQTLNPLEKSNRFIAHAGGGIEGKKYTNSREALENAYDNGFKLFEIDLGLTNDGQLVGIHSWQDIGKSETAPPSREEFLAMKIMDKYSPMDFAEVNEFFRQRPNAILVTDKTKDYKFLAENFVDKDRLLVEVFDESGLNAALQAGIRFPMPSFATDVNAITYIHQKYGVKFFAMHYLAALGMESQASPLKEKDLCIYVYSSNDEKLISRLTQNGPFGFYTDFYRPKDDSVACSEDCKSY